MKVLWCCNYFPWVTSPPGQDELQSYSLSLPPGLQVPGENDYQYDWHYPNCVPAIRLRAAPSIPPWREVQRLPGDGQKPQGVQGEGGWEGAAVPLNLYVSTNFFCSFSILNSKMSKNMRNFRVKLRNATIYPLEVQFLENFFLFKTHSSLI